MTRTAPRRPEPHLRLGASPVWARTPFGVPDDAMRSLWATEGAFRFLTLAYSLFIHTSAVSHYDRPHLASALIGVQCIWSGFVAYALFARARWRPALVLADQLITLALMYATWAVAPSSWWDHNQSLPTTMWATNAVLAAGMLWGVRAGFASALVIGLASLQIGGDLSWLERSPTLPILVSAGVAAGVGSHSVRRAHAQLSEALELRARTAERERLAREVHDGVLQVLALTARQGAQSGGEFARVGALAADQERALRRLIAEGDEAPLVTASTDRPPSAARADGPGTAGVPSARGVSSDGDERSGLSPAGGQDVRRELLALESPRCRVVTGPDAVLCDEEPAREVVAAVRQAIVNTELHAGADATSFVLLEDLGATIVVTVRDDGPGIPAGRLAEARAQGRLGVSGSIVGRIEAIGGTATLTTAPGEGVEWEFTIPRT